MLLEDHQSCNGTILTHNRLGLAWFSAWQPNDPPPGTACASAWSMVRGWVRTMAQDAALGALLGVVVEYMDRAQGPTRHFLTPNLPGTLP